MMAATAAIIDFCYPAALWTHPRRRQQWPCQLLQAIWNDPSPPSTPHLQHNR